MKKKKSQSKKRIQRKEKVIKRMMIKFDVKIKWNNIM